MKRKRKGKFGGKKVDVDGVLFDSAHEAECWLRVRDAMARDKRLKCDLQREYELLPKQVTPAGQNVRAVKYTADFVLTLDGLDFPPLVIDVKTDGSALARDWPLRKKLMLFRHGIDVVEIKSVRAIEELLESVLTI
ncbi:DUF1064 domain-containing protein [Cerasicoccus frondis]|uniref:DUF1064 domain-containing protein n=1 Tax=Cerasicoccus frondis TaxID=490090 RepID=UPI0028527ADF|nr:DUF1064 domain-containing protein [Cerasicoccus frondis]